MISWTRSRAWHLAGRHATACVVLLACLLLVTSTADAEDGAEPDLLQRFRDWAKSLENVSFEWKTAVAYRDTAKVWMIADVKYTRSDGRRKKVKVSRIYLEPVLPLPADSMDEKWWQGLEPRLAEDFPKVTTELWWFDGRRQTMFVTKSGGKYVGSRSARVHAQFTSSPFLEGPYYRTALLDWPTCVSSRNMHFVREVKSLEGSRVLVLAPDAKSTTCTILVSTSDMPPHLKVDLICAEGVNRLVKRLPKTNLPDGLDSLGVSEWTVEVLAWMKPRISGLPPIPRYVRSERNLQASPVKELHRLRSIIQIWSITKAGIPERALEEGPIPKEFRGQHIDVWDQLHRTRLRYNPDGTHDVIGTFEAGHKRRGGVPLFGAARSLVHRIVWATGLGVLLALLILAIEAREKRRAMLPTCSLGAEGALHRRRVRQ